MMKALEFQVKEHRRTVRKTRTPEWMCVWFGVCLGLFAQTPLTIAQQAADDHRGTAGNRQASSVTRGEDDGDVGVARLRRTDDGFFELTGERVTVITDINDPARVDDWVRSFDNAFGQWIDFWELKNEDVIGLRVTAHVMRQAARFRDTGRIPRHVGEFPFGTAIGTEVWIHEQPSDYYTRHLLLHEGVHVLMFQVFGGAGPMWFMEGTAEFLAAHRGAGGSIVTGVVPESRDQASFWGRLKIIRDRRDEGKVPSLRTILRYPRIADGDVETYTWCWAATMMLAQYSDTRDAIRRAARRGQDQTSGFTRALYNDLQTQWPLIEARWAMLVRSLDFGFDWELEAIQLQDSEPIYTGASLRFNVAGERGWQSSGHRYPAGTRLRIEAEGEALLGHSVRPLVSTPHGISLRFHQGHRVGRLLACILPVSTADQPLLQVPVLVDVLNDPSIEIAEESWIFFQLNNRPGFRRDHTGGYSVTIRPESR